MCHEKKKNEWPFWQAQTTMHVFLFVFIRCLCLQRYDLWVCELLLLKKVVPFKKTTGWKRFILNMQCSITHVVRFLWPISCKIFSMVFSMISRLLFIICLATCLHLLFFKRLWLWMMHFNQYFVVTVPVK